MKARKNKLRLTINTNLPKVWAYDLILHHLGQPLLNLNENETEDPREYSNRMMPGQAEPEKLIQFGTRPGQEEGKSPELVGLMAIKADLKIVAKEEDSSDVIIELENMVPTASEGLNEMNMMRILMWRFYGALMKKIHYQ